MYRENRYEQNDNPYASSYALLNNPKHGGRNA